MFIPITESKALSQLSPALEAKSLPRGAYGGAPALPAEDVETITVTTRLYARSRVSDSVVGDVARIFFTERPAIASLAPAANRMEAPATDKSSTLPVHPGAAAYLNGEEETFFEKYSDYIYIGAMLLSVLVSASAALFSRLNSSRRVRAENLIERLLDHLAAARNARTSEDLNVLQADADRILVEALRSEHARSLDANRVTALGLAMDQLRLAIRDRRVALQGAPPPSAA